MSSGVDAPIPPALLYDTRGMAGSAFPSGAYLLQGLGLLRAGSREREHGRNLGVRAWSARDHTLSTHGVSVVLHGCDPHSIRSTLCFESLAVVSHCETKPTFPRRVQP